MQPLYKEKKQSWLSWFFKGLLFLMFFILFSRLFDLSIIKGEYYKNLSDNNRIRRIKIPAERGKIIARGGEILVGNNEIKKTVLVSPQKGYEVVNSDNNTPKEDIIIYWDRDYKLGKAFSHASGYLSEVNAEEVGKVNPSCPEKGPYKLGDFVGRGGLEEEYECVLRGIDGEELIEVDTIGNKIRTIGRKPPISGNDIKTNIDFGLQKKSYEVIQNSEVIPASRKVALIITDLKGGVLALVSSPSFDPKDVNASLNDSDLPLFNRVTGGVYHPGSVYKIVTSVAALEEGVVDEDFEYEDTGVVRIDDYEYFNWYLTQYGRVEGLIDLPKALSRSTDTFFYKVGESIGVEKLVLWSQKFGLAEKSNIDLPNEVTSLVPTPDWKKAVKGERWYLGNTYHMSIGQGDLAVSIVSLNRMVAGFANNGKLCDASILQKDVSCRNLDIKKQNLEYVKKGLIGACSEGGTAYPFFDFKPQVACKTGTAETNEEATHAVFSVIYPAENPEIVGTILVEKGGEGSKNAAPLMREILDYWNLQKNP